MDTRCALCESLGAELCYWCSIEVWESERVGDDQVVIVAQPAG